MGWIFVPMVFIMSIITLLMFVVALDGHRKDYEKNKEMWYGTIICLVVTFLLMSLYTALSNNILISDLFMVVLLISFFGLMASVLYGRSYNKKYNDKNKFKKPTWITLGVMVAFFMLVGMTASNEEETAVANNTLIENETVEEETEEPTEETTTQEKTAAAEKEAEEKQKAKEEAEKEKAAEEAAAKEKEESIEEAKKKEEASIEKEKQKEESIEAEKAEKEKAAEEETASEKESAPAKEGLIPVNLYRVTDGDTVNVLDDDGQALKLRLLLIDTPETVHPNKPVEPYGKEASARLTELLNNADQLYIEYDTEEKTDHYDRHLVYLYADDVNVHEVLLKEGLARVGYIYEQQRYLSDFREAEQYAKDRQLGIWSIPGYVNEGGEGFNSEEEEPEQTVEEPAQSEPETTEQPTQTEFFDNCTDLRGTYPEGVPKGHAAYQSKMDRDKDDYACEVS